MSVNQLAAIMGDKDWRVRHEVASRAPLDLITALANDADSQVRETVLCRLVSPSQESVQ
jgi:hypothetical protein